MHISNEEFKEKIINKFQQDINNIFMIQDYIVLETIKDCEDMILSILKEENTNNKINTKEKGAFSYLVNNKYLLIAKNDDIKNIFSIIYNFILSLSKNIQGNEIFIINNLKEILSLINLILIFNDNITFYSSKKKILLLTLKNDIKNKDEIISSEYYFTCITNKKRRKSLISWDYKNFLYNNFKNNIKHIKLNDKYFHILNLIKDELNIIGIKEKFFYNSEFILNDLEIIDEINTLESRNYHMWTYLRKVYNNINTEGKILIILYSFHLIRKCSFDYSAFCFLVNSKNNFPLDNGKLKVLIKDMKNNNIIKYDEHKCYIDDLEKFILN